MQRPHAIIAAVRPRLGEIVRLPDEPSDEEKLAGSVRPAPLPPPVVRLPGEPTDEEKLSFVRLPYRLLPGPVVHAHGELSDAEKLSAVRVPYPLVAGPVIHARGELTDAEKLAAVRVPYRPVAGPVVRARGEPTDAEKLAIVAVRPAPQLAAERFADGLADLRGAEMRDPLRAMGRLQQGPDPLFPRGQAALHLNEVLHVDVRHHGALGQRLRMIGSIDKNTNLLRLRLRRIRVKAEREEADPRLVGRQGQEGHFDKPIPLDGKDKSAWQEIVDPADEHAFSQWRVGNYLGIRGAQGKDAEGRTRPLRAQVVKVDPVGWILTLSENAKETVFDTDVWSDDGPPIQVALDTAGSAVAMSYFRSAIVYLPAGTYVVGVPDAIDNLPLFAWSNTTVLGDGQDKTVVTLADEVNQPKFDPQARNGLSPTFVNGIVFTNSRSTTWARDVRARMYEVVVRGTTDFLGRPGTIAQPNENIVIDKLTVDGNRDGQSRVYVGGGDQDSWRFIRRLPWERIDPGPHEPWLWMVPGISAGREGVEIKLIDGGGVGNSARPVQVLYATLTFVDADGVESTCSRLAVLTVLDRRRTILDLRISIAKVPNEGRPKRGLSARLYVREGVMVDSVDNLGRQTRIPQNEDSQFIGYQRFDLGDVSALAERQDAKQDLNRPPDPVQFWARAVLDKLDAILVSAPPGFGTTSRTGNGSSSGVVLDNVRNCTVSNVTIRNCATDGLTFSSSQSDPNDLPQIDGGADNCTAINVRMERCGRWAATTPGRVKTIRFQDCWFVDCRGGADIEGTTSRVQAPRFGLEDIVFTGCYFLNQGGFGISVGMPEAHLLKKLRVIGCVFAGQSIAITISSGNPDYVVDDVLVANSRFYFTGGSAARIRTRSTPRDPKNPVHKVGGTGLFVNCDFYHCTTAKRREPYYSPDTDYRNAAVLHFGDAQKTADWTVSECTFTMGRWREVAPMVLNQFGAILACPGSIVTIDGNTFIGSGTKKMGGNGLADPLAELFVHVNGGTVLSIRPTRILVRPNVVDVEKAEDLQGANSIC